MIILILGFHGQDIVELRSSNGYEEIHQFTIENNRIDDYAGIEKTFSAVIPDTADRDDNISIYLVHQYAEIWMDDELVAYSEESPGWHLGRSPGCYWLHIPIAPLDAGKQLHIVTKPVYDIVADRTPIVAMAPFDVTLATWVSRSLVEMILCLICAVVGLIFMGLSFFMQVEAMEKKQILYLGAFTFSVGLWRLFDLPMTTLLIPGIPRLGYFLAVLSLLMAPMLFARFLFWMTNRESRVYEYLSLGLACEAVVILLLQLFNILDLRQLLYIIIATLVLAMIPVFIQSIRNLARPQKSRLRMLLDSIYICFILALSVDVLQYLIRRSSSHIFVLPFVTVFHLIVIVTMIIRLSNERNRQFYETKVALEQERTRVMLSQIQPHFLYNALSVIRTLCCIDPPKAEEATILFSQYLRKNMDSLTSEDPIPFYEELEHVKNYLALEKIRFEDALQVEYDIETDDFLLPPLTLQPIVENAVRHGVRKREDGGTVLIAVHKKADHIEIQVTDNGPGFDPNQVQDSREHIGLINVEKRLKAICNGRLRIQSAPGSGTTATIEIPNQLATNI